MGEMEAPVKIGSKVCFDFEDIRGGRSPRLVKAQVIESSHGVICCSDLSDPATIFTMEWDSRFIRPI